MGLDPRLTSPDSSRPGFQFCGRKSLGLQRLLDFVHLERGFIREVEPNFASLYVGLNARVLYPRQSSECAAHSVGSAARSVHCRDVERHVGRRRRSSLLRTRPRAQQRSQQRTNHQRLLQAPHQSTLGRRIPGDNGRGKSLFANRLEHLLRAQLARIVVDAQPVIVKIDVNPLDTGKP